MPHRQATGTGRAGEFYAAYKLQMHGIDICHIAQGFDLLAMFHNGAVAPLEVKSAATISDGHKRARFYTANVTTEWVAAVWLRGPYMLILPPEKVGRQTTCINISQFTYEAEADSIAAFKAKFGSAPL